MEGKKWQKKLDKFFQSQSKRPLGTLTQPFDSGKFEEELNAKKDSIYKYYLQKENQRKAENNIFSFRIDDQTYVTDFAKIIIDFYKTHYQESSKEMLINEISQLSSFYVHGLCQLQDYRKFIQQLLVKLIVQGSLEYKQDFNYYRLIENQIRNCSYLSQPKVQTQVLDYKQEQDNQNVFTVKRQLFSQKRSKSKSLADFKASIKQQVKWLSQHSKKEQKDTSQKDDINEGQAIAANMLTAHGKEVMKQLIISLSTMLSQYQWFKDISIEQSMNAKIYQIILILSIWQIDLKDSFDKLPLQENPLGLCQLIAKSSKIPQFSHISVHNNWFKIDMTLNQLLVKCRKQKGSFAINPQFCYFFGLQMMTFLKSILVNGLNIIIERQNILVRNNRMIYNITQPFTVTKPLNQLKQINPRLFHVLKNSYLQNIIKIQSRANQFQSFGAYIQEIGQIIESLLREIHFKDESIKEFFVLLKHLKANFMNSSILRNPTIPQQSINLFQAQLVQHQNYTLFEVFEDKCKLKIRDQIIEEFFCLSIDLLIDKWNRIFARSPDQFPTLLHHLNSKSDTKANSLYEHIFSDVTFVQFPMQSIQISMNKLCTQPKETISAIEQSYLSDKKVFSKTILGQRKLSIEQQSIKRSLTIQILRDQYQIKLKILAYCLLNINRQGPTGIHSVIQINENILGIQIYCEDIDPERTVIFAELHPKQANKLFYKLFLPNIKKKSTKVQPLVKEKHKKNVKQRKPSQQAQQQKQFSQYDLQNVVKTFINRTLMAFQNAGKLNIKVSVFLLRHLMIDNHLNCQNYPNLVPRLDVLHSFVETNISNTNKRTDFVEIHYLNKSIAELKLPAESHNKLISAIFFLSLVTKNTQLQFLKQVSQFIQQKISAGFGKINIDHCVRQLINAIKPKQFSDHVSYYLNRIIQQQEFITILKTQVIKALKEKHFQCNYHFNIVNYFYNNQEIKSLRLQEQFYWQTSMRLNYEVGHIFFSYRLTGEITYFIKNTYNLRQQRFILEEQSPSQQKIRGKLLQLLYENTKHLYFLYKQNPSNFDLIKPIIYVKSYLNEPEIEHFHFVVVTQVLNHFHSPKIHNYYEKYLEQTQILTERINDISIYFSSLKKAAKKSLIQELYDIPQQAKRIQFQLLNINIFSVSFQLVDNFIHELEATWPIFEEPPSTHLRPIFDDLTLCRYVGSSHLQTVNKNILTSIFEAEVQNPKRLLIEHDFNAISCPLYHIKFLQDPTFNFFHQNGNIGLVVCLLTLDNKHYFNPKSKFQSFKIHPFFERYRVSKEIIQQNNFSPLKIDKFVQSLIFFVQDSYPTILEPLRKFLINSIHPLEQHRWKIEQIIYEIKVNDFYQ